MTFDYEETNEFRFFFIFIDTTKPFEIKSFV